MLLGSGSGRVYVFSKLGEVLLADLDVVDHVGCDAEGDVRSFPVQVSCALDCGVYVSKQLNIMSQWARAAGGRLWEHIAPRERAVPAHWLWAGRGLLVVRPYPLHAHILHLTWFCEYQTMYFNDRER